MEQEKTKKKYPQHQLQVAKKDYNKNDDPRKPFYNEKGYWDKNGKYRSGISGWQKHKRQRKKCGAKTVAGNPCTRWAMKNGRCPKHGGKTVTKYHDRGADPVGDKETIWHDLLTEEETLFISELKLDAEIMLNEELKLITVRERRMMQRINDLIGKDFTITSKTTEVEKGIGGGGAIDRFKRVEVAEGTLGQIQKIEEALTKVQEKKAKLIELKVKIADLEDDDDSALDGLVNVLRSSKRRLLKEKRKAKKQLGDE